MWRESADLGVASDVARECRLRGGQRYGEGAASDMARECRFRGGHRYGERIEIGAASDVAIECRARHEGK